MLRTHSTLSELIRKETTNPNPRQAAAAILGQAPPQATDAVLFADHGAQHWVVLFVPSEGLPTLAKASQSRRDGKLPVASCPLPRPVEAPR